MAGTYFLVDAAFIAVARPIGDWIAQRGLFDELKTWIMSLRPYPTLALFVVPLIILEPVKILAAYLAATSHVVLGLSVLATGELLKLILVQRLFDLSHNKLMSIAAFARAYWIYRSWKDWLEATDAWQTMRRWTLIARYALRSWISRFRKKASFSRGK